MTRADLIAIMQYILTDVLGQPADGPLHKALRQEYIESIHDMLGTHDKVINEDLQYEGSEGNMVHLHHGHCGLIKALKAYYTHCITKLDPTFDIESDWRAITSMEFDHFHISPYTVNSSTMSPNRHSAITSSIQDPVHEFKKVIKWDPSAFT